MLLAQTTCNIYEGIINVKRHTEVFGTNAAIHTSFSGRSLRILRGGGIVLDSLTFRSKRFQINTFNHC